MTYGRVPGRGDEGLLARSRRESGRRLGLRHGLDSARRRRGQVGDDSGGRADGGIDDLVDHGLVLLVLSRAVGHVGGALGDGVRLRDSHDGSNLIASGSRGLGSDGAGGGGLGNITGGVRASTSNGNTIIASGDRGSVTRNAGGDGGSVSGDSGDRAGRLTRDTSGDGDSLATARAGAVVADGGGRQGEHGGGEGRSQAKSGNILNLDIQTNSGTDVETVGLLGQRALRSVTEETDVLDKVSPDGDLEASTNVRDDVKEGQDLVNLEVESSGSLDTETEIGLELGAANTDGHGQGDNGETGEGSLQDFASEDIGVNVGLIDKLDVDTGGQIDGGADVQDKVEEDHRLNVEAR